MGGCYQQVQFVSPNTDVISSDMIELLMQNMSVQLLCHTREIVGSCLSFIKSAFVIFPVPVMSDHVDTVVKALCNMVPDCQRKYRLKTRDIFDRLLHKFGVDRIMGKDNKVNIRKGVWKRQN